MLAEGEVPDVVGYIIYILAIIFVIGRGIIKAIRRRNQPEEVQKEEQQQKEALKHFLKSLDVDMDELDREEELEKARKQTFIKVEPPAQPKPKPHRKVEDDFRFQTRVEQQRLQTAVEQRKLQDNIEKRGAGFGANIVSPELEHTYATKEKTTTISRGQQLVSRLGSKKEMFILQELLNPPRAFGKEGLRDRI